MQGTRAVGESDKFGKGGSTLRRKALAIGLLAAVVFAAFGVYADEPWHAIFTGDYSASPQKLTVIDEGDVFYVAIYDPERGGCNTQTFSADLEIWDFKTGAYITRDGATFRQYATDSNWYYWWENGPVAVRAGERNTDWVHMLDTPWEQGAGAWEYVPDEDEDGLPDFSDASNVKREDLATKIEGVTGRLENKDTLVLIVSDEELSEFHTDTDQMKISDSESTIEVSPDVLSFGCGSCTVTVTIHDEDENLDDDVKEKVPFFVIMDPGGFATDSTDQTQTDSVTTFCALMTTGGVDENGDVQSPSHPIRWYNIYDSDRYIDYPNEWLASGEVGVAVFFATEEEDGVFRWHGSPDEFLDHIGLKHYPEPGTTFAFYYIDPNDFDDMSLTWMRTYSASKKYPEVQFTTDAQWGAVVEGEVNLGSGSALYVRVLDTGANVNICCPDYVVVHLCDPHNEDDSEWVMLNETGPSTGAFELYGMPLLPVWDAIGGYQLVLNDGAFMAFNEDTIYARYTAVRYNNDDLDALGTGVVAPAGTSIGSTEVFFPPRVDPSQEEFYHPWKVAFDSVKVYDTQVLGFDGTVNMWFVDQKGNPYAGEAEIGATLGIKVYDPDQNENPLVRDRVFYRWNKDQDPSKADEDSAPIWTYNDGDHFTPDGAHGAHGTVELEDTDSSPNTVEKTVKVFLYNTRNGKWVALELSEYGGVNTGMFVSTICVDISETLGARSGDLIVAFYQDPSNHSDVAIQELRVASGGAEGAQPPTPEYSVEFEFDEYAPGDSVKVVITDPRFAGQPKLSGTDILAVESEDGAFSMTWDEVNADKSTTANDDFAVTFTLPADVTSGQKLIATYTPTVGTAVTAEADIVAGPLSGVTKVFPDPQVITGAGTTFKHDGTGSADTFYVAVFDLTGHKVWEKKESNTAEVEWTVGDLINGAYVYVAILTSGDDVYRYRGWVYIDR